MERWLVICCARIVRFLGILSCLYSIPLSPAAELLVPVCWYTLDTTLKIMSSGFVVDIFHRMRELQKNDVLIKEYLVYVDAQEKSAPSSEASIETPVFEATDRSSKKITTAFNAEATCSISVVPGVKTEVACTNLIVGGVDAVDQFLEPGEIFDYETGTCTPFYHDDRGTIGVQGNAGNTNLRVSTDAISILNFMHALGNWLFSADDAVGAHTYSNLQTAIKKTPAEREALHQWCLQRLKMNLAERLSHRTDASLEQRAAIVRGWKAIQVQALEKYKAHLAIAAAPERIAQLTEAKLTAERRIEIFDAELDAIQHEQEARAQKHASQNKQSSYADNGCISSSPGGKDPRDKEKNERYNGPKYANMNEVFESCPFGKRLKECSKRIEGEKYKGAQVYRVTEDMPEFNLWENDTYYLDTYHGEHIEAFKKNGNPRNVLSVDGRSLLDKLQKAIKSGRSYVPIRG